MDVKCNHTQIPCILDDRDEGFGIKTSDFSPTQRAERYGIKCITGGYRRMKTNEELTVGYDNDESYEEEWEYVIRKLTPCECWNLQGFSTEDFLTAKTGSRETAKELLKLDPTKHLEMMQKAEEINYISNSQLYKQAGNSITVDTLYYIFLNLYKAMPYLFDDLKCISFFSGIGAFEMALNRLYATINNPDSAGGGYLTVGLPGAKQEHLGNWINPNSHGSHGGDVWDKDGISPSLLTMQGGAKQPHVVEEVKNG